MTELEVLQAQKKNLEELEDQKKTLRLESIENIGAGDEKTILLRRYTE